MVTDIISEQQSRGFVEQILATPSTHNVHYIPHHPVRKESSTTPIRIVYDCSCRQSHTQPSLNDCLMAGPQFLMICMVYYFAFVHTNTGSQLTLRKLSYMLLCTRLTETTLIFCGYLIPPIQTVTSISTASELFSSDQ